MRARCGLSFTALLLLDFVVISSGYAVSSTKIESKSWDYLGHHIGYEVISNQKARRRSADPILLLNGFGVGSFHQHRLMAELIERDDGRPVYGMDYLGQGRSWPVECNDGDSPAEAGLNYSADMWADQIICFIEKVTRSDGKERVHLVGNSVGGHLAVVVATKRPDLIASVSLLNATPVWGLNLPGWSGKLPAPALPRKIGRYLFDWIRDLGTIEKYLETAYFNRQAFDQELMQQIRGATEGEGGHAAFASIMWSPPATIKARNFYEALSLVECDVLLLFGQEDPWCKPAFAKRMIKSLAERDSQLVCRYLQLSDVGHCPNHEAPKAVAKAVSTWIGAKDRSAVTLVKDGQELFQEEWGEISMTELSAEDIKASLVDKLAATFV